MLELRFVGPGDDIEHIRVESSDGLEQFSLLIDDGLREAAKQLHPRPEPSFESASLSPREIQMRVRSGEDPEELAAEADIELKRVLIFARPVLAERARMTDEARRARARRSGSEGHTVIFGESVDERFAAHGLEPADVRWDAHRREDGQWIITATWRGGEADRRAQWAFAIAGRNVTPLDETAADLLSDRSIRPVVRAVPDLPEPASPAVPPADPPGRLSPQGNPYLAGAAATPSLAGAATTPSLAGAATKQVSDVADAVTGPLPQIVDKASANPMALVKEPVDDSQPELWEDMFTSTSVPEPELAHSVAVGENIGAPGAQVSEAEDDKAARARIPSWDDILLGVRRKRD